jgi:hypothetical protein
MLLVNVLPHPRATCANKATNYAIIVPIVDATAAATAAAAAAAAAEERVLRQP